MRVEIPQIKWHANTFNEPIHSLDFHPLHPERVATAGTDRAIKIWELNESLLRTSSGAGSVVNGAHAPIPISQRADGSLVKFVSSVSSHSSLQVNAVRWHPHTGHLLASGHSQGIVSVWKRYSDKEDTELRNDSGESEDISVFNKESWIEVKQLKSNVVQGDIYDLQWSTVDPALISHSLDKNVSAKAVNAKRRMVTMCRYLVSGSVDSKVVVWDLIAGSAMQIIDEHRLHPVQGIAMDPLGSFFVSQCADRSVMVFHLRRDVTNTKRKMKPIATIKHRPEKDSNGKREEEEKDADEENGQSKPKRRKTQQYYYKKQFQEFFRRLSFSPDGSFLVTVAGQTPHSRSSSDAGSNTAYIFARNHWRQPMCHLGGHKHMVVGVSFCPILFKLRRSDSKSRIAPERNMLPVQQPLDYRMLFALITTKNIIIYDTSSIYPVAFLDGLHFAALNEVKWSSNGLTMMVVSDDGYCSLVMFDKEELGEPLDPQSMPAHLKHSAEQRQKAIQQAMLLKEMENLENLKDESTPETVHHLVARRQPRSSDTGQNQSSNSTLLRDGTTQMEFDDE